jgi:hypothetical protein
MADVELKVTIREQNIPRVLASFTALAGKRIDITVRDRDLKADWHITSEPQQVGENTKAYGERVVREFVHSLVSMVELAADKVRYNTEKASIEPASQNTPKNIVE